MISAVILQIIGLSLFVFGFFPVKPALSGVRSLSFTLSFSDFFLNQFPLTTLSNNTSGPESFYSDDGGDSDSVVNHTQTSLPPHLLRSLYQVFLINK